MNILLVHDFIGIDYLPPIRNLILILLRKGHKVTVIATGKADSIDKTQKNLKCIILPRYEGKNQIKKSVEYVIQKYQLKYLVKEEMKNNDVIWTTWSSTVARLGRMLLKYKHIMQIMELTEHIPVFPRLKFHINEEKYANHAFKVVIPEYNRAHIQSAWWNIKKFPEILPNKPAETTLPIKGIPEDVKLILKDLQQEKRKIILYQGIFGKDRELGKFAEAFDDLSDEYVFYIMGKRIGYEECIDKLLAEHKNIHYIPFVMPPYHLLITQRAHIGILPYKSSRSSPHSMLNGLFCAPNKIFEYAQCGVPMLGSNVPGLMLPFSQYDIGYICETQSKEEIKENIRRIESRYEEMQKNCKRFFDSVDLDEIVERVLHEEP